jgi:hypothetical protein
MENQHKLIQGYRDSSSEEIDLMNKAKEISGMVGDFVNTLQTRKEFDQRWISIGKTDLQKGFMSVIRGIARPTTF